MAEIRVERKFRCTKHSQYYWVHVTNTLNLKNPEPAICPWCVIEAMTAENKKLSITPIGEILRQAIEELTAENARLKKMIDALETELREWDRDD